MHSRAMTYLQMCEANWDTEAALWSTIPGLTKRTQRRCGCSHANVGPDVTTQRVLPSQADNSTNAALDALSDVARAEDLQLAVVRAAEDAAANAAAAAQLRSMGYR